MIKVISSPLIRWILILQLSCANIVFHWVQPSCDPSLHEWSRCLRGQDCSSNGTCLRRVTRKEHIKRAYSTDGQCGQAVGGLLCHSGSNTYYGTCCSQYGWCGNTEYHCGDGCQSDCTLLPSSASISVFSVENAAAIAIGEPTLSQASSTSVVEKATATESITIDGTCGIDHAGTTCEDWYLGSCCSMYGYCGNTTAHCGDGCQSGPCTNSAAIAVPGPSQAPMHESPGSFVVVGQSGVPVMHAALMENGRAVFLDKVENYTQLRLTNGQYAYSSEYDPWTNQCSPLAYSTNAFCSGGSFLADGRLINVGGNLPLEGVDPTVGDGFTGIRYLERSVNNPQMDGQDWSEPGNKLNTARWYASVQTISDGRVFVVSGSLNGYDPSVPSNNNPTFEILDSQGTSSGQSITMEILEKTQPYYMYPFLHVLRDGSVFVFVSKSSELFDVLSESTIRALPDLPGDFRTYPNTGGSVLLPLSSSNNWDPDIVICGGGAYQDISSPTDASCGRMQPLSETPVWELESMPEGRIMVEATLLPDGTVAWLNGCSQGAQGFGLGASPAYEVLIYDPTKPRGQRFTTGASSTIPRLYHSVALLLLDGTIMVAGSNPVEQPILTPSRDNPFVTEFRVEIYTPPYLYGDKANRRPTEVSLSSTSLKADGSTFGVSFTAPEGASGANVVLYHGGFVTHSLHMGHRMAILDADGWADGATEQMLTVAMPPSSNVAPPGPYVIYVLCDGVPAIGQFVTVY